MKKTLEGDVRKALKERVESYGGEIRALSYLGRRHAPDVLCLFPDSIPVPIMQRYGLSTARHHPLVETKRPGKDATEGQAREHERLRAADFVVLVIRSLEELEYWMPAL